MLKKLIDTNIFIDRFSNPGRIITPSIKDFEKAGEIISSLQLTKGYNIKKSASNK